MPYPDAYTTFLFHADAIFPTSHVAYDEGGKSLFCSGTYPDPKFGAGSIYYPVADPNRQTTWLTGLTFNPEGNPFTIDFWVKFAASPTLSGGIFSNSDGTTHQIYILYNKNTKKVSVEMYGTNSSYKWLNGTTEILTGVWYHVALVRTSSTLYLFLNGLLEASATATGFIFNTVTGNPSFFLTANNLWITDYRLDEIRFSTVARWTDSFRAPIQPYGSQQVGKQKISILGEY